MSASGYYGPFVKYCCDMVIVGQLKSWLWVVFEPAVVLERRLAAIALPAELTLLRPRSTSTSRCIY